MSIDKPIVVLSLFDGMSCGQIALRDMGVPIAKVYASEIDKHAIKQTQLNFPDTIQLGDVEKWREWDIEWGGRLDTRRFSLPRLLSSWKDART